MLAERRRASIRTALAVACVVAVWLAAMMVANTPATVARQMMDTDPGGVRAYLERMRDFDLARRAAAPLGALAGGLIADWAGGEVVLVLATAISAVLVFLVPGRPTSMSIACAQAMIGAAVVPAMFEQISRVTRRWVGGVAAMAYVAWLAAEQGYIAAFRSSFERDEWMRPMRVLAIALVVTAVLAAGAAWWLRDARATRVRAEDDPYRAAPPVQEDRSSIGTEWLRVLRDRRTWWLVTAAWAISIAVQWLPAWCSDHLPFASDLAALQRIQRLELVLGIGTITATLVLSDLLPRRRALVVAMALTLGVVLDAAVVELREAVSSEMKWALAATSLVAILPATYVTATSLRARGVGFACALTSVAGSIGFWSTRPLFLDPERLFQPSKYANAWSYAATALAVLLLLGLGRRPVLGGPATP